MDHVDPHAKRALSRYLLDDEHLVVAQGQHWASLAGPVGMAVAGFFLVLLAGFTAPAKLGVLTDFAWKLWFILVLNAAARALMWRIDWFAATDKRLILTYGLIKRRVAMMPLPKVTDMSFNRSALGRALGYGQFVLESAGQEQALRQIDFIRDPEHTYRRICGEIFGEAEPDDASYRPGEDDDPTDPYLHLQLAGARPGDARYDPTDVPVRPVGAFVQRPEKPRRGGLRQRILRGPTEDDDVPFGHEGDTGWTKHND
ncbi:PH domain-containing protein [Flexivirga meconopsidis]|uniref:PH domain-containing protein n=1 Tax=Flexivirga meconopsidis TaxID=2977121 RepID=UPI00223EB2CC|nr:PH domain-containing protein [Flexivirga meconopsidis]